MSNTDIDRLRDTMMSRLNTYSRTIIEGVEKAADDTVKEMVARTKTRPSGKFSTGKYAKAIASQVGENSVFARSRIWYVKKPRYRIAHLINNGHAVRGGGRYEGDKHVTRAAEQAMTDFDRRVREVIDNASN